MELKTSENNVEEPPLNSPTKGQVQEVNLETPYNPRPTFVNAHIEEKELEDFVYFLHEFMDCFAWTYAEMTELNPKIPMHKLNISKDVKLVKQDQWRTKPQIMEKIKKELQKLRDVQFI